MVRRRIDTIVVVKRAIEIARKKVELIKKAQRGKAPPLLLD